MPRLPIASDGSSGCYFGGELPSPRRRGRDSRGHDNARPQPAPARTRVPPGPSRRGCEPVTIHYLCPQCGALGEKVGLCPDCTRADNRRRNQKRKDSGRTTAAWRRMRLAVFLRDGYACRRCGKTGDRKTLTVHRTRRSTATTWPPRATTSRPSAGLVTARSTRHDRSREPALRALVLRGCRSVERHGGRTRSGTGRTVQGLRLAG